MYKHYEAEVVFYNKEIIEYASVYKVNYYELAFLDTVDLLAKTAYVISEYNYRDSSIVLKEIESYLYGPNYRDPTYD